MTVRFYISIAGIFGPKRWFCFAVLLATLAAALCLSSGTALHAEGLEGGSLVILPPKFSFSTTEARQRLVADRVRDGQHVGQVFEGLTLTSDNPDVMKVEDGFAIPVANGKTTLSARIGNEVATAEVTVTGQDEPFQWSFRNHVESIFSKAGCNSGACHGALAGKNGFRLTLFGYDAESDFLSITREARGRRIVPSDPGRSLLLLKPTGAIPHKGGVRLDVDSLEYRVLSQWIAGGTPPPAGDDPRLDRLEILPKASRQSIGAAQQLIVLAYFNDGHMEDVTRWAKFTSANTSVADVDKSGLITVTGPGDGAIKAWYLNSNVLASLSVPYDNPPADVFAAAERRNFIDELVLAKLESLNIAPSSPADDATFIRRAFIDTIGRLPTADAVRAFLADNSPDKRDRLVDHLLSRPEFVDYWSYKWSDLLLVNSRNLHANAVKAYYNWIRREVADDTPWDRFVYQIVTATGSTLDNGAANFYALHEQPTDMAETVSQAFMGLAINCAKCHNHPLEKWTNDQYYGMANLFARVRAKGRSGGKGFGEGNRIVFPDTKGELVQPGKGRPQPPRPLGGVAVSFDAIADRRIHLSDWLTSPENPYFTRAISNRIWANFFGVGIVEKVDDVRLTNPASNEQLLAALARFLIDHDYDLKSLMRAILRSATYQRSSEAVAANEADERYYSRYYPRRLKAEVMLDALSQVTESPTEFKDYRKGSRALELPDSNVNSYFLTTFGRPERIITCDCERSNEPSMVQVLHLYNGDTINNKLEAKGNRIERLLGAGVPDEKIVDDVYLSALSRLPTEREKSGLLEAFAQSRDVERRLLVEDLYWSIVSSKEFLFNH